MNAVNDIVVADDNPAILEVLSAVFRERGYTVRTASDGFAALTLIGERTPRFLLSDLYMPGMSGFELLSVVRRRFPRIAVIAMSGAHPGEDIPAGIAADGFYAKGASSVALLFEILSAIESDASRQSARAQAPIWVSAPTAQQGELPALCVACPECLRPFVHSLYQEETLERDG